MVIFECYNEDGSVSYHEIDGDPNSEEVCTKDGMPVLNDPEYFNE